MVDNPKNNLLRTVSRGVMAENCAGHCSVQFCQGHKLQATVDRKLPCWLSSVALFYLPPGLVSPFPLYEEMNQATEASRFIYNIRLSAIFPGNDAL